MMRAVSETMAISISSPVTPGSRNNDVHRGVSSHPQPLLSVASTWRRYAQPKRMDTTRALLLRRRFTSLSSELPRVRPSIATHTDPPRRVTSTTCTLAKYGSGP